MLQDLDTNGEATMGKYLRMTLAGAVALAWTGMAAAASETVRSPQAASVPAASGAVQIASTANASCQTIACPRYRLVGIAY